MTDWNIEELTEYKPKTTFYSDFGIADAFGVSAIKDTYKRAFAEWKDNVEYLTELTMVLNWKIFENHKHNETYAKLYNDLWQKTDAWAMDNLEGEDLDYFLSTID